MSKKAPTSRHLDDFSAELEHAGDRRDLIHRIELMPRRLAALGFDAKDMEIIEITGRAAKKNFAQRFSTAIAQKIADHLRPDYPDIAPDERGGGHESLSAGAAGVKRIDVNYSTKRSGLELAISVKTMNFKDEVTGRYTKNTKRVDGELRAEAQESHDRQPHAVLAAYFFVPEDSAHDAPGGKSSLWHNADVFSRRAGRVRTNDDFNRFEHVFIGVYDDEGRARFFDVLDDVPNSGLPTRTVTFSESLRVIRASHKTRNKR